MWRFLAIEVGRLIDMPWKAALRKNDPSYKIIKAIFSVITEALRRGEEVKIEGLGTFYFMTRSHPPIHFLPQFGDTKVKHGKPTKFRRVYFTPCRSILNHLDEEDDRKCLSTPPSSSDT